MEALWIIAALFLYIAGIATGMYCASQIEKDIDNRTGSKYNKD